MRVGRDLRLLLIKFMNREFIKFVIGGVINTTLSYLIYLFLLLFLSYQVSYFFSYIFGILVSYYVNCKFVFNEPISIKKLLSYPAVYIVQLLLSYLFLYLLIQKLSIDAKLAPLLVTIVSLPITFVLSKFILKGVNKRGDYK
jgi:putative flippase GtrA